MLSLLQRANVKSCLLVSTQIAESTVLPFCKLDASATTLCNPNATASVGISWLKLQPCAAFATLAHYPDDDVLNRLAEHAVTIIPTFRPQATSNTLWAFAKLAFKPCEALLKAAARQMINDLGKSVPQVCPACGAASCLVTMPACSLFQRDESFSCLKMEMVETWLAIDAHWKPTGTMPSLF